MNTATYHSIGERHEAEQKRNQLPMATAAYRANEFISSMTHSSAWWVPIVCTPIIVGGMKYLADERTLNHHHQHPCTPTAGTATIHNSTTRLRTASEHA